MIKRAIITALTLGLISVSCESDDNTTTPKTNETSTKENSKVTTKEKDDEVPIKKTKASKIEGDEFFFLIDDDKPDFIKDLKVVEAGKGTNNIWVITDNKNTILSLPKSISEIKKIDFSKQSVGDCFIWNLNHENDLKGLEAKKSIKEIKGDFSLSNSLKVTRSKTATILITKKEISGGPYNFTIDGKSDFVLDLKEKDASVFDKLFADRSWVITDKDGKILGTPKTIADVKKIDFDKQGEGDCFIWLVQYFKIDGLEKNKSKQNLKGEFRFSNSIKVTRSKK